jgi:hypothetical protein
MHHTIQKALVEDRNTELRRVAQLAARRSETSSRPMVVVFHTRAAVGAVFISVGTRLARPRPEATHLTRHTA